MTSDRSQPAVTLDPGGAMPLVGLGTWQMTGTRCQAAVRAALDVGYRHIDTATMYGNEREVGRAARRIGSGWLAALAAGVGHAKCRPASSLHPGRGGRTRLPPRGPLAGPL
jgi:Aldo/keto reductase family